MEINNDVVLIPLLSGIPDIANRLIMDNGLATGNGRDIAFDAAGNLHVVSSGQGMYRTLSPGGNTVTNLTWDGNAYAFSSVTIPGGIAGDYNSNGVVDAADYVVWRNAGATDTLPNDPTPGTVDSTDYDLFKANFGKTAGSGSSLGGNAAVPEPSAILLLVVGLLGTCAFRKR